MPQMPPYGEFIFGHEYAGDLVAVGRTVDEFQVGDRVVVEAHMGCRRCAHQFPLRRVHEAIDVLEKRTGDPLKVVLNP